ncbi:MAG TPA: Calx-beta domain-containing protein, partial [Verrucomicrobiae bacterium]|nr:Calx-beta domain-containing protein [Verrucomicrobiae bacterium]
MPSRLHTGLNAFRPAATGVRARSRSAGALGVLASVAILLWAHLATAQALGRAKFFNHDNLPLGDGATTEISAKRARFIRVNTPLLASPDSPLHQPAPPSLNLDSSRLELNLFNDLTLTAAIDRTRYRNGTNFFSSGVVDGWPNSRVILVSEGDLIAASIDVPGLGSYQIRYVGDGLHKVTELDKAQIPTCGPLKRAPAKPRPIRLRKKSYPPIPGDEPGSFVAKPMALGGGSPLERDLFFPASPGIEPAASSNTNVDVMVVYTSAARIGAGGVAAMNTLIDLAVAEANDTYANSLIPVTLNLVFRGEVSYSETGNAATDLTRLQNPSDGYMDSVHALRNQYGADLVCLFTETMTTYAGLGYLMSTVTTNFSSYAFSVVRRVYAAGSYTFPHELGHNMGCAHDRQNSSSPGAYPYSYGYRFVGDDNITYRTVMAYAPGTRIPYFSNPNVSYQRAATGVAIGATNAADNATSISNTAPTVSAFRWPVVILSFTASSNSVAETNGSIIINVSRSSVTNLAVTVDYATTNGTALAGTDYIATNGTLSFAAGETNQTIVVPILDDDLREATETLTIALSNPSVGTLFTSNTTVHILDDDASTVGFVGTSFTVSESTNVVSIEVIRSGRTNTGVTVNYFTANGTATAGADYIATNGLLSFAAGETSKTVSVTVLNDFQAENKETFFVRLRNPTNTTLVAGSTNFTVTIITNDSAVLRFTAITNTVNESDGTLTLTVMRTGTTNNAVSVDFTTTNVT